MTRVLINDRADVALAAGAHGVHLPSHGLPVAAVRGLADHWIVGRSMHDGDNVSASGGADYLLFGTVFPSLSKPGQAAAGIEALQRAVGASPVPVIAIGGITPDRARQCLESGAVGVAAIGLFLPEGREPEALGPSRAVGALRAAMAAS
jgi:thiamine-phosphate diphosphorylase